MILIFWLIVKFTSPGPFIFSQKRAGKNFEPFTIFKIRSMQEKAEERKKDYLSLNEADGPVFKIREDPRLTPIGRFISRTGLDEMLQLINIIKGEMSFVGPRPLPVDEAMKIPEKYKKRFTVKPGITSLWVIHGAHKLTFSEWMKSDLEYIKKKNALLDLYILAITLILIFRWTFKQLIP